MAATTHPTADADSDSPTLTQDALHSVLSNTRRILVIDALAYDDVVESDGDGWVLLTDIADVLKEWLDIDDEECTIYRSLFHSHAPKLDECGVIEQRKEDGRRVVRPGPNFRAAVNARNAVALALGVSDDE